MKKIILFISVICLLSSCRYFNVSPVDGITTKNVSEKPKPEDLLGTWEIDNFSYDLIKENGYDRNKEVEVELRLSENGKFEAINFPEFIDVFNDTKEKRFLQLNGSWKVEKDFKNEYWVLRLDFDESEFYKSGLSINYSLYLKNNNLIIWNFIGDPDSGERFLFEKKKTDN